MKPAFGGLRPWVLQRLTAVYMLCYILFLLAHFLSDPPLSHAAWRNWVLDPVISIATAVFLGSLLLHMWVGVRDVILDYIHPIGLRIAALSLLGFGLLTMAIWVVRFLLLTTDP